MNNLLSVLFLSILGVLLVLSFFFSASETSLIALNKIRLRHLKDLGSKRAASAHRLVMKLDKLIAAVLIGNNFVNIAISSIVTAIFVFIFGPQWGVIIATFCVTFILLIFCEITPKIFAIGHAQKLGLFVAPVMEVFVDILEPVTRIFIGLSNFILKLFGQKPKGRSPLITEEELRLMIEVGKEEGVLSDEERKMLHRIFEFGDTEVSSVMVPREGMVSIDINAGPEKLLDVLTEEGHSRVVVYDGTLDNIKGIIYAHNLLHIWKNKELVVLSDLLHPAYFVLPNKKVNELLKEFQAKKIQIAVVQDAAGKTQGLVTLEDLIEEIVGEIAEEPISKKVV